MGTIKASTILVAISIEKKKNTNFEPYGLLST